MGPGMFDGLDKLINLLLVLSAFGVLFGIYEFVRLVIWLFNNVSISVS